MIQRRAVLAPLFVALAARSAAPQRPPEQPDVKLPSGKSQRDEILKAEHAKSLEDAAELRKLAEELQEDLDKTAYNVLPLATLRKVEQIEKLARRIKGRLRK